MRRSALACAHGRIREVAAPSREVSAARPPSLVAYRAQAAAFGSDCPRPITLPRRRISDSPGYDGCRLYWLSTVFGLCPCRGRGRGVEASRPILARTPAATAQRVPRVYRAPSCAAATASRSLPSRNSSSIARIMPFPSTRMGLGKLVISNRSRTELSSSRGTRV